MKTLTLSQENFKRGLVLLDDDSKAPFGSARVMQNCTITDRGGISPRPGTKLIGAYNTSSHSTKGVYNFKKSKGNPDILTRFYDQSMDFFHPTLKVWAQVETGFTPDQEFDYTYSLVNSDNDDFMYFCNGYDEYRRWRGAYTELTAELNGGETNVPVTTILTNQQLAIETATGNSATSLTVATANWASKMWINFYVYIPSTGKIRKITDNTSTSITFDTLGGAPGNIAFEIRQLAFPATGTIVYAGERIAYTTPDVYNGFPVASAHAAPINSPVIIAPDTYPSAPRGSRIDTLRGRVYVGKVKTAVSRDGAGNLQGSSQASGVFVSKLLDPTNFEFAASRVAGEGDLIAVVYGGGDITDIVAYEDEVAIYKPDYIELLKYTEDENDTAIRTPLKPGYGSVARVIQGANDHFFMRPDKQYTSLSRVRTKDLKPETENVGYPVKRLLDSWVHDNFNGIEFNNRIISSHKSSEEAEYNDVILVYNKVTKSFEGVWSIGANNFDTYKDVDATAPELVYGEANGANVWKMFQTVKSDVRGTDELPYSTRWQSNFFNALPMKSNVQAVCSLAMEGYIKPNSEFTFNLYKDFETDATLNFTFGGTESDLIQGTSFIGRFFSSDSLATTPIGSITEDPTDGRLRFSFIIYFPYIYGQYFSTEFMSSGANQDWEIIRCSIGLKESISTLTSNIKSI